MQTNPELAAFLPQLQTAFAKEMLLIDFGCGNGTQTLFSAQHFIQVMGVDVSSAAIAQARTRTQTHQPTFQILDATCAEEAEAI